MVGGEKLCGCLRCQGALTSDSKVMVQLETLALCEPRCTVTSPTLGMFIRIARMSKAEAEAAMPVDA